MLYRLIGEDEDPTVVETRLMFLVQVQSEFHSAVNRSDWIGLNAVIAAAYENEGLGDKKAAETFAEVLVAWMGQNLAMYIHARPEALGDLVVGRTAEILVSRGLRSVNESFSVVRTVLTDVCRG